VWEALAFGIFRAASVVAVLVTARHGTPGRPASGNCRGQQAAGVYRSDREGHAFRPGEPARRCPENDLVGGSGAATIVGKSPAPQRIRDGVELRNASFRYPGTERMVLEDITLEFPPSGVVAIVGHNGAGKST
jgi:ABC-type multidrug transport system fused ATPase/permease subunit